MASVMSGEHKETYCYIQWINCQVDKMVMALLSFLSIKLLVCLFKGLFNIFFRIKLVFYRFIFPAFNRSYTPEERHLCSCTYKPILSVLKANSMFYFGKYIAQKAAWTECYTRTWTTLAMEILPNRRYWIHTYLVLTTIVLRRRGWLRPPLWFLTTFLATEAKRLYVIYTNSITHRIICIEIWGCRMVRRSRQSRWWEGGGWWNSMIPLYSISLLILPKIPWKSNVSTIFCHKLIFAYSLCILSVLVNISKISRARVRRRMVLFWY